MNLERYSLSSGGQLPAMALPAAVSPERQVSQGRSLRATKFVNYDPQQRSPGTPAEATSEKVEQVCRKCGTYTTPEWRRGPDGNRTLCNACGLNYSRLKQSAAKSGGIKNTESAQPKPKRQAPECRKKVRAGNITFHDMTPAAAKQPPNSVSARIARICEHCGVTSSTQWMKGPTGEDALCNDCGLEFRKICLEEVQVSDSTIQQRMSFNAIVSTGL